MASRSRKAKLSAGRWQLKRWQSGGAYRPADEAATGVNVSTVYIPSLHPLSLPFLLSYLHLVSFYLTSPWSA